MSKPAPQPQTRPARAPVDEDVDDLDDLLEQFAAASSKAPAAAPSGSSSKAAAAAAAPNTSTNTNTNANPTANPTENQTRTDGAAGLGIDDLDLSDDFARELAAGMAALMREIAAEASAAGPAAEPGAARDGKDKDKDKAGAGAGADKGLGAGAGGDWSETGEEERAREEAFRRTWEEMVTRAMDGVESGAVPAGAEPKAGTKEGVKAAEGAGAGGGTDAFQTSILKAMEKLRESESTLNSAPPADEDAALEQLLRSFGGAGLDGDGTDAGDDAQIQGVLEGMMAQLMSKDVLYEPLSELRDKFPGFLRDNGAALKAADRARFEGQQRVVREVVALFEDPAYAPENAVLGARVVALMNEMQSYGAPPTEIMGPLPPGLELGQDGLPALPDGCTIA